MRCLAHRGFAADNPENTLEAVRAAGTVADAIELDVRRCGSGELVVVHDATVDRVTDATGPVAAMDAGTLASLSVLGSDSGIPTLVDALAAVPAGVAVNVELKERGLAADLAAVTSGVATEILVSSFLPDALDPVEAPTALLVGPDEDPHRALARAVDLSCRAIHPHHSLCTEGFVARAHEAGLAVNAWTVRDSETATRLAETGVDGVVADTAAVCP